MKANQQAKHMPKTGFISQRESRTLIPPSNQNIRWKDQIHHRYFIDNKDEAQNQSQRYKKELKERQNISIDISLSQSLIAQSDRNGQSKARSFVTVNQQKRLSNSVVYQPNKECKVAQKQTARQRQLIGCKKVKGITSSTQTTQYNQLNDAQDIYIKQLLDNKEKKGCDHYRHLFTKQVNRSQSAQADTLTHFIQTPLINCKNFFLRKRQIETNLNCNHHHLHQLQNFSIFDKRKKSFFINQCKEEAQEFHEAIKEEEKMLKSDLDDRINLSIKHTRTKLYNKYCISKHLEQNRIAKTQQLIF